VPSFQVPSAELERKISKEVGKSITVGFYEIDGVAVWGLDLVRPDQEFDVSVFVHFAREMLGDIEKRGKLPIIVGGTGFYIRGLLNPYDTVGIPVNQGLRKELEPLTAEQLQLRLKAIDKDKWEQMNESDRNNPRRLVRAVEVGEYRLGLSLRLRGKSTKQTENYWS
jgi:tRNA dimethylallyltransferase